MLLLHPLDSASLAVLSGRLVHQEMHDVVVLSQSLTLNADHEGLQPQRCKEDVVNRELCYEECQHTRPAEVMLCTRHPSYSYDIIL